MMVNGGVDLKEKKEIDKHIGQQIKTARKAAGFSQEKFAEMIGMGPKNVSAIERGVVGVSILAIKKICKILGVSSDSLIMDKADDKAVTTDNAAIKINKITERLKSLPPQQLEITINIINKILEAYILSAKIISSDQYTKRKKYPESKTIYCIAESPDKPYEIIDDI